MEEAISLQTLVVESHDGGRRPVSRPRADPCAFISFISLALADAKLFTSFAIVSLHLHR